MSRIECKAIIFDLDGTLVDSSECIERIWREWCSVNRVKFDDLIAVSHGRPTLETMREFLPTAGKVMADWFLDREMNETDGLKQLPGAGEFISKLPENCWAIATSGVFELASARVIAANLDIPKVFITADMVNKGKPDPESFIKAAEKLGVKPSECVVFEDSKPGLNAAVAFGAKVVGVKMHLKESDMPEAEFTINDFNELKVKISKKNNVDIITIALQ